MTTARATPPAVCAPAPSSASASASTEGHPLALRRLSLGGPQKQLSGIGTVGAQASHQPQGASSDEGDGGAPDRGPEQAGKVDLHECSKVWESVNAHEEGTKACLQVLHGSITRDGARVRVIPKEERQTAQEKKSRSRAQNGRQAIQPEAQIRLPSQDA